MGLSFFFFLLGFPVGLDKWNSGNVEPLADPFRCCCRRRRLFALIFLVSSPPTFRTRKYRGVCDRGDRNVNCATLLGRLGAFISSDIVMGHQKGGQEENYWAHESQRWRWQTQRRKFRS